LEWHSRATRRRIGRRLGVRRSEAHDSSSFCCVQLPQLPELVAEFFC
jgi:hypothetical protein